MLVVSVVTRRASGLQYARCDMWDRARGIHGELSSALRTDVYASGEESYSFCALGMLRRVENAAERCIGPIFSKEEVNEEHWQGMRAP